MATRITTPNRCLTDVFLTLVQNALLPYLTLPALHAWNSRVNIEKAAFFLCLHVCGCVCFKGRVVFPSYLQQERSNHSCFPRDSQRGKKCLSAPAKSIFLLKKKVKWPMHVNTTVCVCVRACVDRGGKEERACTSLDYGRGEM